MLVGIEPELARLPARSAEPGEAKLAGHGSKTGDDSIPFTRSSIEERSKFSPSNGLAGGRNCIDAPSALMQLEPTFSYCRSR